MTLDGVYNLYAYCDNDPVNYTDPSGFDAVSSFLSVWFAFEKMSIPSGYNGAFGPKMILDNLFPLLIVTVGTLINLVVGKISWQDIKNDLNNFNCANTDAGAVIASKAFSFYKGTFVIRHYFGGFATSMNLFKTIFLNKEKLTQYTLDHEWGHSVQNRMLGNVGYIILIGLPSLTGFFVTYATGGTEREYYSLPWERTADYLGGVNRNDYSQGSLEFAMAYLTVGCFLFNPFRF
jgi:hypothetical protein